MIDQEKLFEIFNKKSVNFFTGVPDSYLNDFCNYVLANVDKDKHIIAANEGNAIGIAAGNYFATGNVPVVYMQNSGLGNCVNPLASLVDEHVYGVPMILIIGWRGPGEDNHPQHKLQGEITQQMLDTLNIPFSILEDDVEESLKIVEKAIDCAKESRKPFGLIVPKGVMTGEKGNTIDAVYPMSREEAIEIILDNMPKDTIYSATTGRATRELFFLREKRNETKTHDFLNVGSMGHASSVALGMALAKKERKVVVLDGDSAAIMHMGSFATNAKTGLSNYIHIILNNGAHESVGGQPSAGHLIDFTKIAEACGYKTVGKAVETEDELVLALRELNNSEKASFIDCRIHKGLSSKLPPIIFDHREYIDEMMRALQ